MMLVSGADGLPRMLATLGSWLRRLRCKEVSVHGTLFLPVVRRLKQEDVDYAIRESRTPLPLLL